MSPLRRAFPLLLIPLLLLSSCAPTAATSRPRANLPTPPDPAPLPAREASPAGSNPTPTPIPAATVPPAFTAETPSPAPTVPRDTGTPEPALPSDAIEIRSPGPLSQVASPIEVRSSLGTGAGGLAFIELLGEDGRLLYAEVKAFDLPAGTRADLELDIDFEIPRPTEAGRLQIWVRDEYGRVTALNSVPLTLLSAGGASLNPPDTRRTIVLQQPGPEARIDGGMLVVSGRARVEAGAVLLARLVTPEGRQIGQRLAEVTAPFEDGYGSFTAEVPYQVNDPTPALLVVSLGEADHQDIIHLSSREVLLGP